jgi:Ca2+-binding RTX toxin-like protein
VSPVGNTGDVQVKLNANSLGTFHPTGHIIVFGQAGDDDIEMAGSIGLSALLYGGEGDDRIKGGGGHDILLGGADDDLLVGGQGRDILIGGVGNDRLVGNADDDILVAGSTDFDANDAALCAIMDEWIALLNRRQNAGNLAHDASAYKLPGDDSIQSTASFYTGNSSPKLRATQGSGRQVSRNRCRNIVIS